MNYAFIEPCGNEATFKGWSLQNAQYLRLQPGSQFVTACDRVALTENLRDPVSSAKFHDDFVTLAKIHGDFVTFPYIVYGAIW